MLRTLFSLILLFLMIASAAAVPAFSLSFNESRLLTSFPGKAAPYPQGADTVNINGFVVDKNAVRPDFGGWQSRRYGPATRSTGGSTPPALTLTVRPAGGNTLAITRQTSLATAGASRHSRSCSTGRDTTYFQCLRRFFLCPTFLPTATPES